jgi:hypothetical protein
MQEQHGFNGTAGLEPVVASTSEPVDAAVVADLVAEAVNDAPVAEADAVVTAAPFVEPPVAATAEAEAAVDATAAVAEAAVEAAAPATEPVAHAQTEVAAEPVVAVAAVDAAPAPVDTGAEQPRERRRAPNDPRNRQRDQ